MRLNQVVVKGSFTFFVLMGLSQCTVTPNEEVATGPDGEEVVPFEGICFETEILPLLVSRCGNSGCHNAIDREDGIDLTSYEAILKEVKPGDPSDSEIIESMYERGEDVMPPFPAELMKTEQIKLIEDWISDGAKNTTNCVPSGPCNIDAPVSFKNDVLPIIDNYCYGCHSTVDPQGGYSYSTYNETLKSVNDGTLLGSIRFENGYVAMPENSKKMPSCNIDLIRIWIEEGVVDN